MSTKLEAFTASSAWRALIVGATNWNAGQWTPLYMLSCNNWRLWSEDDIVDMLDAWRLTREELIESTSASFIDIALVNQYIETMEQFWQIVLDNA
jgi:hypothetical protein